MDRAVTSVATQRPLAGALIALLLLVAACSGGGPERAGASSEAGKEDGGGQDGGDAGSADGANGDGADGDGANADGDGSDGSNAGSYAIVTVGDQRFEFDLAAGNNGCSVPMEGVLSGGGFTDDADPSGNLSDPRSTGAQVTFAFTPESGELGDTQVIVRDFANDVEWWADPAHPQSGVEPGADLSVNWVHDGKLVSGTTSFVDPDAARVADLDGETVEPTPGSFEISCGAWAGG